MKQFNGHRSWSAWNVSLWLSNDEGLNNRALFCITRAKELKAKAKGTFEAGKSVEARAAMLLKPLLPERTPDGARYSYLNLKLALKGLID